MFVFIRLNGFSVFVRLLCVNWNPCCFAVFGVVVWRVNGNDLSLSHYIWCFVWNVVYSYLAVIQCFSCVIVLASFLFRPSVILHSLIILLFVLFSLSFWICFWLFDSFRWWLNSVFACSAWLLLILHFHCSVLLYCFCLRISS